MILVGQNVGSECSRDLGVLSVGNQLQPGNTHWLKAQSSSSLTSTEVHFSHVDRSSFLFSWNFCETAIDRAYHSFIYI